MSWSGLIHFTLQGEFQYKSDKIVRDIWKLKKIK